MTFYGNVIPCSSKVMLSVRYDISRNVIPMNTKGVCITRYDFSKKSHAAFLRLIRHARSGMTFYKNVIPTEINRI